MTGGCGVAVGPGAGAADTTGVETPGEDVAGGEYAATDLSREGPDSMDETDIGFPLAVG